MFKNSSELLDYAFRKIKAEIKDNPKNNIEVKIKLGSSKNDVNELQYFVDEYQIKISSELLRIVFDKYYIKSIVGIEGKINTIITHKTGCELHFPVIWTLTLQKKNINDHTD